MPKYFSGSNYQALYKKNVDFTWIFPIGKNPSQNN